MSDKELTVIELLMKVGVPEASAKRIESAVDGLGKRLRKTESQVADLHSHMLNADKAKDVEYKIKNLHGVISDIHHQLHGATDKLSKYEAVIEDQADQVEKLEAELHEAQRSKLSFSAGSHDVNDLYV